MITTVTSIQDAIRGISALINSYRFPASSWYVGITGNPADRLAAHKVDPSTGIFRAYRLVNDASSRLVENYFIRSGTDGGDGGGGTGCIYVYVYLKTPSTKQ